MTVMAERYKEKAAIQRAGTPGEELIQAWADRRPRTTRRCGWASRGDPGAGPALRDQPPELDLVQKRDSVALLAQAFDLHQLQAAVAACGLQRVRPPADDDRGLRGGSAVHDCACPARRCGGIHAARTEDSREGHVHALQ